MRLTSNFNTIKSPGAGPGAAATVQLQCEVLARRYQSTTVSFGSTLAADVLSPVRKNSRVTRAYSRTINDRPIYAHIIQTKHAAQRLDSPVARARARGFTLMHLSSLFEFYHALYYQCNIRTRYNRCAHHIFHPLSRILFIFCVIPAPLLVLPSSPHLYHGSLLTENHIHTAEIIKTNREIAMIRIPRNTPIFSLVETI